MHRDPNFDKVYRMECWKIKNKTGCATCHYRGEHLAWDKYQCKLNNQKNKYGSCRAWIHSGDQ